MTRIRTSGGTFVIEVFGPDPPTSQVRVQMLLRFEANAQVDATAIGFVQVVRVLVKGEPYIPSEIARKRSIPRGEADWGARIDYNDEIGDCSPIYGLTVPCGTADGPALTQGQMGPGLGAIGRHVREGDVDPMDAVLQDFPEVRVPGDCSMVFETAALVLAGNQKARYLGAIRWMWSRTGKRIATPTPTKLSDASPKPVSHMFRRATECWNAAAHLTGAIPIP